MSDIDTPRVDDHGYPGTPSGVVDADNPWLGLDSFTEETRQFFHGRNAEIAELARRVQRKLLTVLFGQSGLGKTSILRAGIVPRLRREGYCPVYVRIDYSADSPEPSEQIKHAIFAATEAWGNWSQPGAAVAGESLWEFLHHRDDVLRDASGKPLVPLLIFDQFEEIFTLAQDDAFGRRRASRFMQDLADLAENRTPKALEELLESDESIADRFDFGRADYRILVALREDYLAHLEGMKEEMPSITQNRMRLARMTGKQALDAVMKPGGRLVSGEVAESIVRFVAGGSELANAEVEPALLSLVCRELNNARIARGRDEISADVLAGSNESILREFYERVVGDQPAGVRRFIEDEMLTASGYRENIAEERVVRAFALAGAGPDAVATLVTRRLLRIEERLDMRRVELTHDVLCEVVKESRDLRQQREAREENERLLKEQVDREAATRKSLRRARQVAAGCAVLAIAAIGSALFGYLNMRRAGQAEAQAQRTHQMAEGARAEAEKLIVYMLDDLYLELEPVGRLDVVGELSKRALDYYAALPPELRTSETNRNRALALARNGLVLTFQGKIDDAVKVLDEAIAVLEGLRREGDRSEASAIGLGMALLAKTRVLMNLYRWEEALKISALPVDVLSPFMSGAAPSIALKRAYGAVMNSRGIAQSQMFSAKKASQSFEIAREAYRSVDGLQVGDLASAAGYAESSAGLAQQLVALEREREGERMAEEGERVASRVLERRPGHMPALRSHALNVRTLRDLEGSRLHLAKALGFAAQLERDWQDYLKLDPGNAMAWSHLFGARTTTAELLEAVGEPTRSVEKLRSGLEVESRSPPAPDYSLGNAVHLVELESDLGHDASSAKAAADCHAFADRNVPKLVPQLIDRAYISNRCVQADGWAAIRGGDYQRARAIFRGAIEQLEAFKSADDNDGTLQKNYVGTAWASYNLADFAAAEREMRHSLALADTKLLNVDTLSLRRADLSDRQIFIALSLALQGRRAEAKPIAERELKYQRGLLAAGSDSRDQHVALARALLAAALASPDNARQLVREAAAIVDGLPADKTRLRSIAQLRRWIAEAS